MRISDWSSDVCASDLFLNSRGKVSEGPGMCFFMIRDGVVITPSTSNDILESITRTTVIELLREKGRTVVERDVDRSEIVAADEAFFCGTAWEVTPVTMNDCLPVGNGKDRKSVVEGKGVEVRVDMGGGRSI